MAASRGHRVRVVERSTALGGMAAVSGPGAPLVAWLAGELEQLGVPVALGCDGCVGRPGARSCCSARAAAAVQPSYDIVDDATVLDIADVRAGIVALPPRAVWCSTRSAVRSPSRWPRSSASGPHSSRRTSSPATSCRARATWRPPTCGSSSAACASSAARGPCARCERRRHPRGGGRATGSPARRRTLTCCGRGRLRLPPARRGAVPARRPRRRLRRPPQIHEAVLEGRRAAYAV